MVHVWFILLMSIVTFATTFRRTSSTCQLYVVVCSCPRVCYIFSGTTKVQVWLFMNTVDVTGFVYIYLLEWLVNHLYIVGVLTFNQLQFLDAHSVVLDAYVLPSELIYLIGWVLAHLPKYEWSNSTKTHKAKAKKTYY